MRARSLAALLVAGCTFAAPAGAQTVLFADDFEGGLAQWTTSGLWRALPESDDCANGLTPFPSPGTCAAFNEDVQGYGCGFYTSVEGDLALAQPVTIPSDADNARLFFTGFEETECAGSNCGWDHRYVQVSSNGGQYWTTLASGALEGHWSQRSVSLDAYRGSDVLIRFRFDPIDDWENQYRGWLVDDVRIEIDSPFTPYCKGKVSTGGCVPYVEAHGDVSLTGADDLVISGLLLRNNVMSKLVWSRSPNNAPFHGGTLCVAPPAARTSVASSGGSAPPEKDCTGTYAYAFTHAYLASKSVLAGETLYVQYSGRDPGFLPPNNHSLSAALSFTVLP